MAGWSTGQWAIFALDLGLVGFGLYLMLFAGRVEARQRAKNEAAGIGDEGGYQSPLSAVSPRTQGAILLAFGAFGLYRYLLSN